MTLAHRLDVARALLSAFEPMHPSTLRTLAIGLSLAGEPLSKISDPLDCAADSFEHEDVDGRLAELKLAWALRQMARHPATPRLLERLGDLPGPPWECLRAALADVREAT